MAPNLQRSWAKRANTPIVKVPTQKKKISAIAAVAMTNRGRRKNVFFRLHPQKNIKAQQFLEFLVQLRQAYKKQTLLIVWDNFRGHKAKIVENYASKHRIHIEYLPPYAPELNPVEAIWGYLKNHALSNYVPDSLEQLRSRSRAELIQLKKRKSLLDGVTRLSPLMKILS